MKDLLKQFDEEFGCDGFCIRGEGATPIFFNDHHHEEADDAIYGDIKSFLLQSHITACEERIKEMDILKCSSDECCGTTQIDKAIQSEQLKVKKLKELIK